MEIDGIDRLGEHLGSHLGYSEWLTVTQDRIDRFADATDDHQWIHTDPERAADGPFGAPIAHGFLTLALLPPLLRQIVTVTGPRMAVNCGSNRVRFVAPVTVGAKVRLGAVMVALDPIGGGVQLTYECTWEIEGSAKPACVGEIVFRYYR